MNLSNTLFCFFDVMKSDLVQNCRQYDIIFLNSFNTSLSTVTVNLLWLTCLGFIKIPSAVIKTSRTVTILMFYNLFLFSFRSVFNYNSKIYYLCMSFLFTINNQSSGFHWVIHYNLKVTEFLTCLILFERFQSVHLSLVLSIDLISWSNNH